MLQNYNITKVMEVFFKEPSKEHYLIELSRKTNIAHTSVKNFLNQLKKEGIILERKEKKGNRLFPMFYASINSLEYRKQKIIWNYIQILESGIIQYLKENLFPKSIILFGSYSRGEDVEDSDIDIYLECKKGDIKLEKFEKFLGRKIEIHFNNNFNDYPKELKNNIINGKILDGYLEAYK
ncbi:MAG: nucleotidyltransferase domain-containing protein [Candidatus Pacearchaeota archaeon]|jgi:predicted nucleotidyltransferase